MKTKLLFLSTVFTAIVLTSCNSDRTPEDDHNTGNGSMESPINGIPPGEPDSMAKDHMRVDQDTIHQ
jgi:hypothetical protein